MSTPALFASNLRVAVTWRQPRFSGGHTARGRRLPHPTNQGGPLWIGITPHSERACGCLTLYSPTRLRLAAGRAAPHRFRLAASRTPTTQTRSQGGCCGGRAAPTTSTCTCCGPPTSSPPPPEVTPGHCADAAFPPGVSPSLTLRRGRCARPVSLGSPPRRPAHQAASPRAPAGSAVEHAAPDASAPADQPATPHHPRKIIHHSLRSDTVHATAPPSEFARRM